MSDLKITTPQPIQEALQGAIYGDFNEKPSGTSLIAQIGTGMIPIVGQMADARDTAAALKEIKAGHPGAWSNLGLALTAWVPLVGDGLKASVKGRNFFGPVKELMEPITERAGSLYDKVFYRPKITMSSRIEPKTGGTDEYGNIFLSPLTKAELNQRILHHEKVHSFLTPRFKPLLYEARAKLGHSAYWKSYALRFLEEGLAESYSLLRTHGLEGFEMIKPSVKQLFKHPNYRMDYSKAVREAIVASGITFTTGVIAGEVAKEILSETTNAEVP